jgi:hypothetical protein
VQERGEPPPPPLPTYYDVISSDEDATLRTIVQITTGITSIADPVQASLEHFEKRWVAYRISLSSQQQLGCRLGMRYWGAPHSNHAQLLVNDEGDCKRLLLILLMLLQVQEVMGPGQGRIHSPL